MDCYTFTQNLKVGHDIYRRGQRIQLDKEDYEEARDYLVLTSEYKGPPIKRDSKGCGCK